MQENVLGSFCSPELENRGLCTDSLTSNWVEVWWQRYRDIYLMCWEWLFVLNIVVYFILICKKRDIINLFYKLRIRMFNFLWFYHCSLGFLLLIVCFLLDLTLPRLASNLLSSQRWSWTSDLSPSIFWVVGMCHHPSFMWYWDWTQVFVFARPIFYPLSWTRSPNGEFKI